MIIAELIARLKKYDQTLPIVIMKHNDDGCDTCGYGHSTDELDAFGIVDLETRIVLDPEHYG